VRIFWAIVGFVAAVILALVLFRPSQPTDHSHEPNHTLDPAIREAILNADIPDIAKEAIIGPSSSTASPRVETPDAQLVLDDDERLRAFDEL
jgi:hypothetical protein